MADPFDDLMKYWEKTTDEHVEWQKKRDTFSIGDLYSQVLRLANKSDEFEEHVKDIKPSYPDGESTLIAAKFKNRYEIYRFLTSVLMELNIRLASIVKERSKPVKKETIDPKIKNQIAKQVKIELVKALKKSKVKHDSKGTKKSL